MIIDMAKNNIQIGRAINLFFNSAEMEISNPIIGIPIHTISCNNSLLEPINPRILVKNITYQIICNIKAIFKVFLHKIYPFLYIYSIKDICF